VQVLSEKFILNIAEIQNVFCVDGNAEPIGGGSSKIAN